jgi:hypothetical protein
MGKIMVQGQSQQKVHETPSEPIAEHSDYVPVIPVTAGSVQ